MMKRSNISLNGETNTQHTIHWTTHNRVFEDFAEKLLADSSFVFICIYCGFNLAVWPHRLVFLWFLPTFRWSAARSYCELVKRNDQRVHTWNTKARSHPTNSTKKSTDNKFETKREKQNWTRKPNKEWTKHLREWFVTKLHLTSK